MVPDPLILAAEGVRLRAYAPYSRFSVGAALLAENGEVFLGCNVENISYGLTVCAERVALQSAITAGHRSFRKIAIVSDSKIPVTPCGACRQCLAEFSKDLLVVSANLRGERFESSLSILLPRSQEGILG